MRSPSPVGAFRIPAVALLLALAAAATAPRGPAQQPISPQIRSPVRIARDATADRIVVSDSAARRIRVLDHALQPVSSFVIQGQPLGVATAAGIIAVGNATRHAVEFYDLAGHRLGELPTPFAKPNDIAIDTSQRRPLLFVVDTGLKMVKVVPLKRLAPGTYPAQLPLTGPAPTVLANPTAIALDPAAQEILVSDFGDAALGIRPRVQIFGYDGALKATLTNGSGGMMGWTTEYSRPQGLAVDDGRVFLVDSWLSRILIYDRTTLALTGTLGTYGSSAGELSLPLDLVIDGTTKDVFVTNNRNRRLEVFVGGAQ